MTNEKIKTNVQIYDTLRLYIEKTASRNELVDMLIETMDNYSPDIYKDLYSDHIQDKQVPQRGYKLTQSDWDDREEQDAFDREMYG